MHGGIPIFVHVCSPFACVGRLWISFGHIYSEKDFLLFLFFFPKKNHENKKGDQVSPAVGGEEMGGCMRPVLNYCALPAVTTTTIIIIIIIVTIIIISAVLLFYNII